jgi:hypothetical protein
MGRVIVGAMENFSHHQESRAVVSLSFGCVTGQPERGPHERIGT